MPLESLRQPFDPEQAGHKLREVQVEHEPEKESAAKQKYEALKDSGFYNPTEHVWRKEFNEDLCYPVEQFIGMMALSEFDLDGAKQRWEDMSHNCGYERHTQTWNWGKLITQEPYAKLASIACQMSFDRQGALAEYESFCKEQNASNAVLLPQPLDREHNLVAPTELFHLLVQLQVDPAKARERYKALKEMPVFDLQLQAWHKEYTVRGVKILRPEYCTRELLLGILIEAELGLPGTVERYEALKQSSFFDPQEQLWNYSVRDGEGKAPIYSSPQLISVIIESRLEKLAQQKLAAPTKLPEERNF